MRQFTDHNLPPLEEFVDRTEILGFLRPGFFQTRLSFEWYERRHREELAESGAVIVVAGRKHYHPDRLQKAICAIGSAAAAHPIR